MITSERAMYRAGSWLIGCLFMTSMTLGIAAAASEDSAPLMEVMTVPGPPAKLSKGYFANNPGCVSAKLDTWEGDKANPTTQQIMDADSTTILVGREGCRYRIRIERAE
jgi:hypothetical protein